MKNHKTHEGTCKFCRQVIWWRQSRSGRRYPADPDQIRPHDCPKARVTKKTIRKEETLAGTHA